MSTDDYLDPPGGIPVPRTPPDIRDAWAEALLGYWEDRKRNFNSGPSRAMEPRRTPKGTPTRVAVTWGAFPASLPTGNKYELAEKLGYEDWREVRLNGTTAPPRVFDGRENQDEYLEWRANPGPNGGIASLDMTCEPPDIWRTWFDDDADSCATAYSDLLGVKVVADDLRSPSGLTIGGATAPDYNDRNRWNVWDGIVHLTQQANSLGAEVQLARDSGHNFRRATDGQPFGDKVELCGWTGVGQQTRNSDPNIAWAVNTSTITSPHPVLLTLTAPVGLYITEWDNDGRLQLDGGSVSDEWWVPGHGATPPQSPVVITKDGVAATYKRVVRLHVGPPPGTTYQGRPALLSDCTIDGEPVVAAGQLIELVTMGLFVDAWPLPANTPALEAIPRPEPDKGDGFAAAPTALEAARAENPYHR
jgi:hypothetical protein